MSDTDSQKPTLPNLVFQAEALLERQRFGQARRVLAQGLKEFPDSADLQYLGAFVDYSEDRLDDARRAIGAVLLHAPQHFGARSLSAHLHESAGELQQAEATWIDLLREYPENPSCYAAYAELMLKTLHVDKARRLAQEGMRHSPDHDGCLYVASLADVIQGSGRDKVNPYLQKLLQEHPERARTLIALVVALDDRGESRSALRVAQQLLRTRPDSEPLARLVRQLKMRTHWSLLPLYPMQRWGWGGAAILTVIGLIGIRIADSQLPASVAAVITLVWVGYAVYSWVWPGILRKLLKVG